MILNKFAIIVFAFITLIIKITFCQPVQRNPGAGGVSLFFSLPLTISIPPSTPYMTFVFDNTLGLSFTSIQSVGFGAIGSQGVCQSTNSAIISTATLAQNKISIQYPFTLLSASSQIQCNGVSYNPKWMNVQLIGTFEYGGTININAYYDTQRNGISNQFGSAAQLDVLPDQITDSSINFSLSATPSQVISQLGQYTLLITTPLLAAQINQIVLLLPMYWYPDTALPSGCQQTSTPVSTSFSSTLLQNLSASVTTNIATSLYSVTLSFQQISLGGQAVDLTFQMTNPFTSANIVLEGQFLQVQASFNYYTASSTPLTAFQTSFTSTNINAQPTQFSNCNNNGAAQILCSSTSSGTYTNSACLSGQTMFVKIIIYPVFFQDIYSSVQFTLSNIPPNQSPITGITMQIINSSPSTTDVGLTITSSVSINNQIILFPQYLTGAYTYLSYPFICMANPYTQYLSVTIPNFQLPYDIDGLLMSAQFYVQPFLPAQSYSQAYQRDTSSASILNASCGNTQLQINKNFFSSAQVITANPSDLQVGATQATHIVKIISKYTFVSSVGKIQLTLPPTLSINPSGTFSCTAKLLLPDQSLVSITVTSCTYTGSPVIITLSYSYGGTLQATGFVFTFNQVINPTQIQYSGNFQASTFLRNGSVSDANDPSQTNFGFYTQPAPFSTANLVNNGIGTKLVYTFSPYTLTLASPVTMLAGDQILVNFPSYISEINSISITTPSSSLSATSSNNQVPLVLSVSQNIPASTSIIIQFTIRNPPVSNLDYTFTIVAQKATPTIYLQSNINYGSADSITPTGFSSFIVSSSSPQNLANAVYSVSFTPNVLLQNPSTMILTFIAPTTTHNFLTTGSTTCSAVTNSLIISCTPNSPSTNQLTITLNSMISPAASYQFTIQNVLNYMSLAPFIIKGDIGYSQNQVGNESTSTISNTQILSLSAVTLSIQNYILGIQSQYQFSINNVSPFPALGNMIITTTNLVAFIVPSTVSVNLSACPGTSTASQLNLSCYPNQDSSTITIQAVNNPTQLIQQSTTPFVITLNEIVGGNSYAIKSYTSSNLVYTNQCNISSFCKTCQNSNQSICQSCYSTNSITYQSSTVYVQETILNQATSFQSCVASCPQQSYQTSQAGQAVCLQCDLSCATCINSSTNCTSCSGNLYLDTTTNTCNTTCPAKYFKSSNNQCQLCSSVGNCLTCTSANVCTSCDITLYLQNTQCVTQCDSQYYVGNGGRQCMPCPTGCNTCTSALNCTSCSVGYIQFQTTCVQSCPQGYSKLIQNGVYVCGVCDPKCKTCDTLSTTCTSCYDYTYLYNQTCVTQSQIPEGYYGDNTTWTVQPCMTYCISCSFKALCNTCASQAVIYQGICYASCPSNVPVPDGAGGCKEAIIPTAISDNNTKIVPFPMLLSCIAFCISVYFSKYEKPQTFVPGCIVGFCALFEWISWIILIGISFSNDGATSITTITAVIGFVLIYLINFVYFMLYKKNISPDPSFMEWQLQHKNRICKNVSIFFSCVISFKIQKIIFCKYFNQIFFKAKLKDIDLLTPFNKMSIFSIIFNSFLIIFSASVFSYRHQNSTQIYILSLDTLLVTIFMIIFMIWEALKNEAFFDENYNLKFDQMSYFTQRFFPFDQSYMERAKQRSVYGHLKNSESNSSLIDFGKENKVTKVEQLQQPQSQIMDPNDISTNAALDRNVINNSNYGAPYLIQDEISESSKPGKKRQFEKRHIAPVFDNKNFPPIQENSLEDEDEDFYEEDIQNQSMKKMVGVQNSRQGLVNPNGFARNKFISLDDQQDLENQRNNHLNNSTGLRNNQTNSFNKNNCNEEITSQYNQADKIYQNPQQQQGQKINKGSTGVHLQEDEIYYEEQENQKQFSKQQNVEKLQEKTAMIAVSSMICGAATSKDTKVDVDKNENITKQVNLQKNLNHKVEISQKQVHLQSNIDNLKEDNSQIPEISQAKGVVTETGITENEKIKNEKQKSNQNENNIDKQSNISKRNLNIIKNENESNICQEINKINEMGNKQDSINNQDKNINDKEHNLTDRNSIVKEEENKFNLSKNVINPSNKKADGNENLFYFNNPLNSQNEKNQNSSKLNKEKNKNIKMNQQRDAFDENLSKKNKQGKNSKMITPIQSQLEKNNNQEIQKANQNGISDFNGANQNQKTTESKSKQANDIQNAEENKVERIMPIVEDLDEDLSKQDKNLNEIEKKQKIITSHYNLDGNTLKKQAPQKNNLLGISDSDEKFNQNLNNINEQAQQKNNIYDSDESLHSVSEADANFNEISPSDFNILNQRYEEDFNLRGPQLASQVQLNQQSLRYLNRNITSNQSEDIENTKIISSITQNEQGLHALQQSNRNTSLNILSAQNFQNEFKMPQNEQKQGRIVNGSLFQDANSVSINIKQNRQPHQQGKLNNQNLTNENKNENSNSILPNPNMNSNKVDQMLVENLDNFNKTFNSATTPQAQYQRNFNLSFNNQDPQMSQTQMYRGNMSSRSKGNYSPSSQNITYKVPATDLQKLKSLEQIYLQRIEANSKTSQASRKNILKNKKKKIQREISQDPNFKQDSIKQMKSPNRVSEIYFGERVQNIEPYVFNQNGEDGMDFEEDFEPENLNFESNF
ncbi:transmembrane protein, putative (macronuclear) [Tetrahymena thermophila SB210]|uniref:Transmembrane protein, putative n=1 Tax=Tetrahymena thermophila (strain SB210) TaxID=312017 RepID=Q23RM7_TETTS|nr:transmembrane protein, putative [Tetrahymena thermophila SB210]EAR99021.4 transmembrane protein, putative [Tetrahymena thermophila SB210]|eukprot:XP_001019266.4 transmembrane protein, putative [Tetrahymena thermophila SB210]